jgi:Kdo2-lipid IVA lauroyltransferase/acyltransferase
LAQKKSSIQIWLEYAVAGSLIGVLRFAPLGIANALARATAHLLDLSLPKLRRTGLKNLSFAFPNLNDRERSHLVDGVFRSIARLLVAIARFPSLNASNIGKWISYEGIENYQSAKEKGSGVLVATGHLGNWELSAFAHALMTEPMHVMVRALDNPFIDNLVETRRALSGNHLIYKVDAARAVIKALRSNEAVGILIDQNTTPAEGVFIDFFGKRACAGSAFVKLAYHTKAAVIPGFAFWEETQGRYILRFYPEVPMTGDITADTQRIHSIFEAIIHEYPDQWMWIHRRWKTRPPGEEPLY